MSLQAAQLSISGSKVASTTPRVVKTHPAITSSPGCIRSLLLKMLRRHHNAPAPQRTFRFHHRPNLRLRLWHLANQRQIDVHPLDSKCGTAYSFTRKKPGLSSISSTTTLASRSGWEACSSSPGSVISVTVLRTRCSAPAPADAGPGGADIFALDHLQVVRDARQQEDVRQTRVDTAVGGGVGGIVQRRFLRGVGREEAGVIAIFVVRQRDKARAGELKLPRFRIITSEGIFTGLPVPRSYRWIGKSFTAPPACGPRICTHQPLLTKLFTILDAKENAALVQRYFS